MILHIKNDISFMILSGGKMKDLKKENLENMSYKDIANLILENSNSLNTLELFSKIVELLELICQKQ